MKNIKKIAVFSSIFLFSLTSCASEPKSYCLETSDTFDYYEGKCFQANRNDVVDTVFVMNMPTNPEADPEEYKYDIRWNDSINTEWFSFAGGLKGKRIIEVFKWSDTVLKINFDGRAADKEATSGYVRISPSAYKAYTKEVKNTYLYAYVAIGDSSALVDKPVEIER